MSQRDILTADEKRQFLQATQTFEELLFCRIGIYSGLRIAEILNLEPRDIIFKDLVIKVRRGKGGVSRWANIDPATSQLIQCYISENKLKLKKNQEIFTKSKRTYQRMVEKIGVRSGIDRVGVHPHMLRHTNITMLLEKGMPIEKVQAHAGHKKITTTQIYTHLTYKVISKSYRDIIGY